MNKEHNFISAVVYVEDDTEQTVSFFQDLYAHLHEHFLNFEIIAVNSNSAVNSAQNLKEWGKRSVAPVSILYMSAHQQPEQGMNAGLDCAIGDYVYEFDCARKTYDFNLLTSAYNKCLSGYDIVSVCTKKMKFTSRLFYDIFNLHSHASSKLQTDVFRLISRRAINRVHAISNKLPYRKAAYAASGLKTATIELPDNNQYVSNTAPSFNMAVNSLLLYTDFGYKFSLGLSFLMFLATFAEMVYTVVIWLLGIPISGWTTTMFAITFGFTCIFMLQTIILKYLTLILDIIFHKQPYLIERVERL